MFHLLFHALICCLRHNERTRYGRQQNLVVVNGQPVAPQCLEQQMEEPKIKTATLKGLGITQIILGIISIAIGTALFMQLNKTSNIYTTAGLWGGAIILLSASFTMAVGFKGQEVTALRGLSIAFNIVGVVGSAYCGGKVSTLNSDILCDNYDVFDNSDGITWCSRYKTYLLVISVVMVTHFVIGILAASFSGTRCCCYSNRDIGGAVFVTAPPPMVVSTTTTTNMPPPQYPGQPYQYPHCAPPYTTYGYPAPPSHQPPNMQMTTTVNSTNLGYTMQETHDEANLMVNS